MSIINNRAAIVRDSVGKLVKLISAKDIPVYLVGSEARVNMDKDYRIVSVFLPVIPDDADDVFLDAVQGFLDHECGHILFTDSSVMIDGKKDKESYYWNAIEDVFIERQMAKAFTGSALNISRTRQLVIDRVARPLFEKLVNSPEKKSAKEYWQVLGVNAIRAKAGQPEFIAFMEDKWEYLTPEIIQALDDVAPSIIAAKDSADCLMASRMLYRALHKPNPPASDEDDSKNDSKGCDDSEEGGKGTQNTSDSPDDFSDDSDGEDSSESRSTDDIDEADDIDESGGPDDEEDDGQPQDDDAQDESDEQGEPDEQGESDEEEGEGDEDEPVDDNVEGDSEDERVDGEDGEDGQHLEADEPDFGDDDEGLSDDEENDADDEEDGDQGDESDDNDRDDDAADMGDDVDDADDDGEPESGDLGDLEDDGEEGEESDGGSGAEGADDSLQDFSNSYGVGATELPEPAEREAEHDDSPMAEMLSSLAKETIAKAEYTPFTTSFDLIEPVRTEGYSCLSASAQKLDDMVKSMVGPVKQQLRGAFLAKSKRRWRGGLRQGRLNDAALSRLRVDDDRVFRRREVKKTEDVDVTLLIDESGSMLYDTGYGGKHTKLTLAAASAWAMSEALSSMGVNHEILTFTTHDVLTLMGKEERERFMRLVDDAAQSGELYNYSRYEPIRIGIVKAFSEKFGAIQKQRLAAVSMGRYSVANVDGESLLIAARRLLAQRSPGKALIVLSDGYPAFAGNGNGESHLKAVVKSLEALPNMDVVGIGIDSYAVQAFYKRHVVLHNIEELPDQVIREVRRILLAGK